MKLRDLERHLRVKGLTVWSCHNFPARTEASERLLDWLRFHGRFAGHYSFAYSFQMICLSFRLFRS